MIYFSIFINRSNEYDKAWYKLVDEIIDLDDQLSLEHNSGDQDALSGISFLEQQLETKKIC